MLYRVKAFPRIFDPVPPRRSFVPDRPFFSALRLKTCINIEITLNLLPKYEKNYTIYEQSGSANPRPVPDGWCLWNDTNSCSQKTKNRSIRAPLSYRYMSSA